jgi:hypothetical protein
MPGTTPSLVSTTTTQKEHVITSNRSKRSASTEVKAVSENARVITKLEEQQFPAVQMSETNLGVAVARVPECVQDLETAEDLLANIESSLRRLEPKHNAVDLAHATAAVRVGELRLAGAETARERARTGLRSADAAPAEIVASAVRKALPGIEVIASWATPSAAPPNRPCVVVSTSGMPERTHLGTVTGEAIVRYYTTANHKTLDKQAIVAQSVHLSAGSSVATSSSLMDTLKVHVTKANLGVPQIPAISEASLRKVGQHFAPAFADRMRYEGTALSLTEGGGFQSSHITATPGQVKIAAEAIDRDGSRTLTVHAALVVHTKITPSGTTVLQRAQSLACEWVESGFFVPGLGVVTDCEILTASQHIEALSDRDARQAAQKAMDGRIDAGALSHAHASVDQLIVSVVVVSSTGEVYAGAA